MPKRKDFLRNEKILNTRGDQAFYMGAENAKIESAKKSAETGGHPQIPAIEETCKQPIPILVESDSFQ